MPEGIVRSEVRVPEEVWYPSKAAAKKDGHRSINSWIVVAMKEKLAREATRQARKAKP